MCPQFLWLNVVKTDQNMLNPHLEPRPHPPGRTWSPEVSEAFFELGYLHHRLLDDPNDPKPLIPEDSDQTSTWWKLQNLQTLGQPLLTFDLYNLGMCQNSTPQTLHGFNKCWSFATMSVFGNHPHAAATLLCLRDRATLARVLLAWTCGRLGMAINLWVCNNGK